MFKIDAEMIFETKEQLEQFSNFCEENLIQLSIREKGPEAPLKTNATLEVLEELQVSK